MRPRLTLPQLWLALAIVLPGLAALLASLSAVDLAYQLRAGTEMLDGGGIPRTDTYTFTVAGQPWLDQQWGAQVLLAAVWRSTGWAGLVLIRSVVIWAAWACLLLAIRWRAPALSPRAAAVLALGAFLVTAPALALRPQLLAILLFCLTLALLAGRHRHPRLAWAIPVLVAAWVNIHGSFVLGPVLVGLAWLEDLRAARQPGSPEIEGAVGTAGRGPVDRAPDDRPSDRFARRTFAVAAVAGLATLVNPFGFQALVYAATLSSNRELAARVTEWQPPSATDPTGLLFFASLVLVAVFLVRRRPVAPLPGFLTLAAFAALGLLAARGVAWWPAVAAVTVAPLLPGATRSPRPARPRVANAAIVAALVLAALVLAALPFLPIGRPADAGLGLGAPSGLLSGAPSRVTAVLRGLARPGDRTWNPQPWGSWLELAIPALPVAVDSRIELFPADVWADYDTVAAARVGWQAVLDRREVTLVLVAPDQASLRDALAADPGWRAAEPGAAGGTVFVRADRSR